MPIDVVDKFLNNKNKQLFYPRIPTIISGFPENSNAKKAGLMKKDVILGINGGLIKYFDEFKSELLKHKGGEVELIVNRNNDE